MARPAALRVDVVVVGDTAVLTAAVYDEFERAGEPGSHTVRLTLTWVREDGVWRVLAATRADWPFGDSGRAPRRSRCGREAVPAVALAVAGCGAATPVADRDCGDFADQAAAQQSLDANPGDPDGLDADGNGEACESLGSAAVAAAPAESRRARVLAVVDGDTIKVRLADGAARPSGSSGSTRRRAGARIRPSSAGPSRPARR